MARPYSYNVQGVDADGDPLAYELLAGPVGMSIDSTRGTVRWLPQRDQLGSTEVTVRVVDPFAGELTQTFVVTVRAAGGPPLITSTPPTEAAVGHHAFTIRAIDARGGVASQDIEFDVVPDSTAPRVTVLPTPGGWPWDGPIVVFVSAVDNVGVTSVALRVNGVPVLLDSNRTARLSYADWGSGTLQLTATARDAAGNVGEGTGVSFYRNPDLDYETNPAVPEASITSPSEADSVQGLVTITGTAAGPDFKAYRLWYRRADEFSFTQISQATTAVVDGVLGVWDTSLLENDSYVLRLEATDQIGSSSVSDVAIGVSGEFKLGNFRTSFNDMTIPVGSIPVTITRTYDTLRADRDGDFGFGWQLEYRDVDLRTSLPRSGLEDLGIHTAFRQ